jgi:hypothetical protein
MVAVVAAVAVAVAVVVAMVVGVGHHLEQRYPPMRADGRWYPCALQRHAQPRAGERARLCQRCLCGRSGSLRVPWSQVPNFVKETKTRP